MARPAAIKPLSQEDKIAMLIYSHPSAGKTSFIAEAAAAGQKVLLIRSPLDHIPARALRSGMEQWIVHTWEETNEAMEYIRHEGQEWDWAWLDSVPLVQDTMLQDIFDGVVQDKPHRGQYGPDRPEYRVNMWRIEQWVRHTVGAQTCNIGLTSHAALGAAHRKRRRFPLLAYPTIVSS